MHTDTGPTRRWLSLLLLAGALAYLGWRLVTVVADPSVAAAMLLLVEALAWIGMAAFLARVGSPYHPTAEGRIVEPPATTVVGIVATGRPVAALERTLASLDTGDTAPAVLVVDDSDRTEISRLAAGAGATVIRAGGPGAADTVTALARVLPEDAAVVLVEAGSLLAADALHALVEPMRDATVAAVQGALDWADPATITVHGPSRDGLGVLISRQAPSAGAAGVAPILGDGVALRARALTAIDSGTTDLTVAFASAGWHVRFVDTPVAYRPRPASASEWRATRSTQVAEACRSARAALHAPGLAFTARARIVAGAGDVASAYARVGIVAVLVAALLSGSVPIPGPLGATLLAAAALWSLATLAVQQSVSPVLRVGDRMRLGWHRLDADALAPFGRSARGHRNAGRIRSLIAFPLSVVALLAVDVAGFVRGLALVRPSLVPAISTPLARATIGIATLAVLALLVDSLRVFVARPDGRTDLRVPARVAAIVGTQPAELHDLSRTGAGVVCAEALPPGTVIQLRFKLPGGEELAVDGTVARVEHVATAAGSSAHHVGVRFGAMDPETHRALVRYVAITAPRAAAAASATALPRASAMPVPRPLLRFASVMAVIVACTSLVAAPAAAASPTTQFTGTVSGPSGPLGGVCVSAVDDAWQWWTVISDPAGGFTVDVPAGSYRFQFRDCAPDPTPRLASGWWSPSGLTTNSAAAVLSGADGQPNDPITVTLPVGGWLTGAIQDPGGVPLDGICVTPVSSTNDWDGGTATPSNGGAAGSFETAVLIPGQYRLRISDCIARPVPYVSGWVSGDGTTVSPFQDDARVFDVADAALDAGTITLPPGTRIAGTVADDTGAPAPGICVAALGDNWTWVGGGNTGPDGAYTIDGLPAGDWVLSYFDCNPSPTLVNTLYNGTPSGTLDFATATRVHTDASMPQLDGYDQTMTRGGRVSGSVHAASGPQANVCVNAIRGSNDDWQWLGGTQTGPDGSFSLGPIAPGDISVHADSCGGSAAVIGGFYTGPGVPLSNDQANAATLTVGPDAPIEGLDITVELGVTLSGTVLGDGAPLADACVSALDPTTGYTRGERTQAAGTWRVVVPSGSYLVQATDCVPGRGFAGRFLDDTADPAAARVLSGNPGDVLAGLDLNLPSGSTGSITGRLTTGAGAAPQACVVAVAPETEPAGIVQTGPDGTFELTGLNPGSYLVGFAGCDFGNDLPPGITDPTDPSFVYPLQWSSGRSIEPESLWADPAWVTVAPDAATDLGVVCLQPCNEPDEPVTQLPTDPSVTPAPPVSGQPDGFVTDPDPVPPTGTPFPDSAASGSTVEQAERAIAPAPPAAAVEAAENAGGQAEELDTGAISARARTASATHTDGSGGGNGGGSSWWWLFVLAAAVAAAAAGVPWLRSRAAS